MSNERKTILIVDDSALDIQLISELLKESYRIQVAKTPEKALEIAHGETPPDLILLDVLLPRMDGYELCQIFKSHAATSQIPVIFITGNITEEERWRGLDLGAIAYLIKPIEADQLERLVRRIIG